MQQDLDVCRLFAAVILLPFRIAVLFFALLALPRPACAEIGLAPPFRDHAILQRDKPVLLWGRAAAGEKVQVSFAGQQKDTTADASGHWTITLDALATNTTPAELKVSGTNIVVLKDILVGEVWLCSGQSNMNLPVTEVIDAPREIAAANTPLIRELNLRTTITDPPNRMVDSEWRVCDPDTVRTFSATGYFFARELHRQLGVPIGIIKATLGGSPIEAWISPASLASDPAFAIVAQRWEAMRPRVTGDSLRNEPGSLYRRFIEPLLPSAIAGFVWYQGEGNTERADEYSRLLTTMIPQWRTDFRQGDIPFIFAQLPRWDDPRDKGGDSWPRLREAQASALKLPHTGMAVLLDIGDSKDLHPRNKQEAGRRLARIALAQAYGKGIPHSGPVPIIFQREGSSIRLKFDHAQGLKILGDASGLFELSGTDAKFLPAQVTLEGDTVRVTAPGIEHPTTIRFEWKNDPQSYLVNDDGLIAAPFRRWMDTSR